MDIVSLYYFSELAKDLHVTRTANRLFISQQTLSNHIGRLEEYYGVPLLNRKPRLSLTCAGELVLAFAELVNREHTNLKDRLSDIEQQERGLIRFGASHLRVNGCLPQILPRFSVRYPNVELRITDDLSSRLELMVVDGVLDFAIVLLGEENPRLESRHLMADQVYLCVADSLLVKYYGEAAEELKESALRGARVADFARLPFCLNSNRMGREIAECFAESQITPNVYAASPDAQISLSLCCQQLAACFATHTRLVDQRSSLPANLNIFPLCCRGEPMTQQLALIRRRDRYLSNYAKLFLDLLFRHFADVEQMRMERKV